MKACIITIGDELLIGQTVDTNSAWMGKELNRDGIQVESIITVNDTREGILSGLEYAKVYDLVLLTGGLGPTKDDITKKVLADYFSTELVFHQETYDRLCAFFEKINRSPNDMHKEQSKLPQSAIVLENKQGTAPGMWFESNGTVYVSMPGVPYEMKHLMKEQVLPRLQSTGKTSPIYHRTLLTIGKGESTIAEQIAEFEDGLPDYIKMAYLPSLNQVKLRLTGTYKPIEILKGEVDAKVEELRSLIGDIVWGEDEETFEQKIGELCVQHNLTLGTAESCTGGAIASMLSSVPGASRYYYGSIVAYDNTIKEKVLSVKKTTLKEYGAVSEQTVKEMALGAREQLSTEVSIAISGILGPSGGTKEKPVGTIWLAVADSRKVVTKKLELGKSRDKNKTVAVARALNMALKFLLERDLA